MNESRVDIHHIGFCELDDQGLLPFIKSGNENAFSTLYKRNWKKLFNAAYKRLQDKILAQDVVQNVFTDLWGRRQMLDINNISSYLHGAIRFQCLKQASEQNQNTPIFDQIENTLVASSLSDGLLLENELTHLLKLWIEALPPKRRKIFLLHYTEELSTSEIASQLNLTQKTVQNQIGIATHNLRNQFEKTLFISLLVEYANRTDLF